MNKQQIYDFLKLKNIWHEITEHKAVFEDSQIIGIHPNDNTATVWIKIDDLINIIREHGNEVYVVEI